jgi:Cu+-exporting ATPase
MSRVSDTTGETGRASAAVGDAGVRPAVEGATGPGGGESLRVGIRGMHCAACVRAVETALEGVPGVLSASVSLPAEEASLSVLPGAVTLETVRDAVASAGYEVVDTAGLDERAAEEQRERDREARAAQLLRKFWVGAVLSVPVLLFSHHEVVPFLMGLPVTSVRILWAVAGVLTLPIVGWVGVQFFTGAWKAMRRRQANMDTLVAVGTGSAFAYSWAVVLAPGIFPAGTAHPFFEATAVVITLVVLGQGLEARARGRTTNALRALLDLRPPTARRLRNGQESDVALELVEPGDVLAVRPGERVPIDGVVVSGTSALDESALTGESVPVDKGPGDTVVGGTMNRSGTFRLRVTRVGKDTVLSRIVEMVRQAQASKPPIERLVDRVAGVFVPVVLGIAAATFFAWYFFGPEPRLSFALAVSVSVLVIACPCALGLATPISVMIAVGKAAEHGTLIRSGEALQKARRIRVVALDKTGTLTKGEPSVVDARSLAPMSELDVLAWAASAESGSEHPLGRAILAAARERGASTQEASSFEARGGLGVRASVGGKAVLVGGRGLLEEEGVDPTPLDGWMRELSDGGKTVALVAVDGKAAGALGLVDEEKGDSREAVARLKRLGLDVVMLTGDNERTARAIADRVGIDRVLAGVRPEGKEAAVSEIRRTSRGPVAMVGDGINDAPALASADVGIAIGSGTDVAKETADVVLMGSSLHGVADTIELSRATIRNMKQNLLGAFVYNVAAIPIAAGAFYPAFGILLSPLVAGAAMAFSSVTVVTNANRLRGFRPSRGPGAVGAL